MKKNHFYNLPFSSTRAEYQDCVHRVTQDAVGNESVVSVYLLGGAWQPGISDIDILLVQRDECRTLRNPWDMSTAASRIFTHRYLTFHQDDFALFYYIYPALTTDLRVLSGEKVLPQDPRTMLSRDDYHMLLAFNLADVLINKLLVSPIFKYVVWGGALDVRRTIGELHSLNYTVALMREITGMTFGEQCLADIDALRRGWFSQSPAQNEAALVSCIEKGSALILEVTSALGAFFEARGMRGVSGRFRNKKYDLYFSHSYSSAAFLAHSRSRYTNLRFGRKTLEHFGLLLPVAFATVLAAHGDGQGLFSQHIKTASSGELNRLSMQLPPAVRTLVQTKNTMYDRLVKSRGFYRVPFLYGVTILDTQSPLRARLLEFYLYMARGVKNCTHFLHLS